MARKRKSHTAAFKAQVALAAVKGDKTVSELASLHGVHPTMIHTWKKQLLSNAEELFHSGVKTSTAEHEVLQAQLYEQIGRLKTELDWLKKKLPASVECKRTWVDPKDPVLSVSQQCALLDLSRSSYYYELATESPENLALMALIDREYTDHPFRGSRGMTAWLRREGHEVNRKRIQRLMRLMGLEAVYPKPRLSVGGAHHKVYPYLLRGVTIERPNQVWSTDITYIPMPNGFMYLTAVIDWYSRYVLSWRVSNTLDTDFCLEALEEALKRGHPEVFNTDQGAQFTSASFVGRLESAGVKVSMDGKGRCLDNVFVERLWRTVKYEYVYLWRPEAVPVLTAGLTTYFGYYNEQRTHQSLQDRTPAEVYQSGPRA